jgi:hypothetical protein
MLDLWYNRGIIYDGQVSHNGDLSDMRTALIILAIALLAAPAGAGIININSATSGVTSFSLGPPLTVSGVVSPVQLTLGPGQYTLTLVEPPTTGALYVAWARASSGYYSTAYVVYDDSNTSTPLLYGGEYLSSGTASDAWNQTIADHMNVSYLTLSSVTTLDFVVPDVILSDNSGGVSINVQTPEPGTLGFCGLALAAGAAAIQRRRRCRA